ncbi:Meiotic recombination protein rec14 [Purpureocillium lavendulum]|uniref:Meiotic recombination protein rec14 n=1 Tax=Purpureocillium lavendulum TaxID=1247861 RepID=A0AB34FT45_9HYPO|nr:Meiotic recombination protein rec14 [Purpureocillium lavendulum]
MAARLVSPSFLPTLSIAVPGVSLNLPTLDDIWESVLRAVPKNKVSHSRKRHRQMAGKALKDVNNLCKCPGCGETKRTHRLCQRCLEAHITDIFSLATTPRAVLSVSGSSTLHVHDTTDPAFPLRQSISDAHKLGCHHICSSRNGKVAASAGFGGEVKLWALNQDTGDWSSTGELGGSSAKPGEVWALALSEDGSYLASTTNDGRINVWDIRDGSTSKVQEYETGSAGSGSFGMCVDLSRDGRFTASGHQNGAVYIFNNDTGRIFTRLAAAGDAGIIALYDMKHGEHVGNLTGHASWITSIDWSDTGEFLLSGSMDGKVKVWSIERSACVATHSETDKALWAQYISAIQSPHDVDSQAYSAFVTNPPSSLPNMPTTRRSTGGARARPGPTKGQSTISFSSRVTKSVPKDTKKDIVAPAVAKVAEPEKASPAKEEEEVEDVVVADVPVDEEEELEVETPQDEPQKSEAEAKAEKISDAQINKYWKNVESQRKAPRVHQEGLGVSEKVLRYFDVSSQYGRWQRADRLGLHPPIEVLAVLLKEEQKGTKGVEEAQIDHILNSIAVGA